MILRSKRARVMGIREKIQYFISIKKKFEKFSFLHFGEAYEHFGVDD
jgi:hypothetical protein